MSRVIGGVGHMKTTSATFRAAICLLLFVMAPHSPATASLSREPLLFGLVTGLGHKEDDAFNDMLYNGMVLARAKYAIKYMVATPENVEDDVPVMEALIRQGCNVIIAGGGYHMIDPVGYLAQKYPQTRFVLMDDFARSYPPNVSSVTFRQNEGSFLAGALAALMSKTRRISFLGAADLHVINDFYAGYAAGAKHVRPSVLVDKAYIFAHVRAIDPYKAPDIAREISLKLCAQGSDIIFAVAAHSNTGAFAAVKEKNCFAIGVDADQDHVAKGFILTSMLKRLDTALLTMVEKILDGSIENRNYSLGLAESGVDLSPMTYTKMLIPPSILEHIADLRRQIIQGDLAVPSAMPHSD